MKNNTNAWLWIPTLYFASGLPYHAITSISDIMYKDMGIGNTRIALYTSFLLIPWTIKPLWSPFVEILGTRRKWTVYSQLVLALCFVAVAACIPSSNYLALTIAAFMVGAFVSATHDIALDGFYILALSQDKQSFFSGIRNTFYRIATVFGSGVLVMLANELVKYSGNETKAWSATFIITALIMLALFFYNRHAMPSPENDVAVKANSISDIFKSFGEIITSYFRKPGVIYSIIFLLLFRFPEAQLGKIGKLFLMDPVSSGGLGLDKGEIGFINGIIGVIGLIAGGIIGGICISRQGLKYWLWPMVTAISLPDAVYIYMSMAQPDSLTAIGSCILIEQFGYGFGFTAYMLYLIYFSEGEFKTAHYSLCTAFMALSMMLPGMVAGYIQETAGYTHFFIFVMICCLVTVFVTSMLKVDPEFGKKQK